MRRFGGLAHRTRRSALAATCLVLLLGQPDSPAHQATGELYPAELINCWVHKLEPAPPQPRR